MGSAGVLGVAGWVVALDQVLLFGKPGSFCRVESGVDVGGTVAFRAGLLFVVAQALVEVLGLADVLGNPLSRSIPFIWSPLAGPVRSSDRVFFESMRQFIQGIGADFKRKFLTNRIGAVDLMSLNHQK